MQKKTCFFQEQQERRDRDIPIRSRDPMISDLQYAKLNSVFDDKKITPYTNALCQTIWGVSYRQIHELPILGLSIPNSCDPEPAVQRASYTLDTIRCLDAPGLSENYYFNPLCWGNDELVYIGGSAEEPPKSGISVFTHQRE